MKNKFIIGHLFLIIFLFQGYHIKSQINFTNPSFEGEVGLELIPPGWISCNATPDTGGDDNLPYGIEPSDGNSYAILVGWEGRPEAIGQELPEHFIKNTEYSFEIDIAYIDAEVPDSIGLLEIILSHEACNFNQQKIILSNPIDTTWTRHKIKFIAQDNYNAILFKNGEFGGDSIYYTAIMIDNLSPIIDKTSSIQNNYITKFEANYYNNQIHFKGKYENLLLRIYNVSGQLIYNNKLKGNFKSIDISNLQKGVLFLELIDMKTGGVYSKQIITM